MNKIRRVTTKLYGATVTFRLADRPREHPGRDAGGAGPANALGPSRARGVTAKRDRQRRAVTTRKEDSWRPLTTTW